MSLLFRIKLPYATAGIVVDHDIVIEAAPIFGWMLGKPIQEIEKWVGKKKGTLIMLDIK